MCDNYLICANMYVLYDYQHGQELVVTETTIPHLPSTTVVVMADDKFSLLK